MTTDNFCLYEPIPPRAWSRVDNACVYFNNDTLINKDTYEQRLELIAQLRKGNILQYKKNSSHLTKQQRYSLIARGLWTNRSQTWATQSQTYTNPNTTSLKRVNYTTGPTLPNTNNLFGCPNATTFKDGGNLICGVYENPCTGETIPSALSGLLLQKVHPSSDSNVPGPIVPLYWDERLTPWYPRVRYTMNNSSNKWPQNYKLFVSALH